MTYEEAMEKAVKYLKLADDNEQYVSTRENYSAIARSFIEYAKLIKENK